MQINGLRDMDKSILWYLNYPQEMHCQKLLEWYKATERENLTNHCNRSAMSTRTSKSKHYMARPIWDTHQIARISMWYSEFQHSISLRNVPSCWSYKQKELSKELYSVITMNHTYVININILLEEDITKRVRNLFIKQTFWQPHFSEYWMK
jgi:hypothetical protein